MKTLINKKLIAGAVSLILLFIFLMPVLSSAAIVNCGVSSIVGGVATITNPCDFTDFIGLINGIINWIIGIAGVIFTISAIYGGFLYMTSGTSLGDKEKAKSILWSTLIGFVIILCAWLIVYTILTYVSSDSSSALRFLK